MGNKHVVRQKKYCQPVKVESVTPTKVTSEFGFYSQKVGEEIKTVSVGLSDTGSNAAFIIILVGGAVLILNILGRITNRDKGAWKPKRTSGQFTESYSESFGLFGRIYSDKQEPKKCIPMSVPVKS